MRRRIIGFHADDAGDWVAELSCLHGQHVRHRPPFCDRAWVLDAAERQEHLGSELDCPLCDRAELPSGLHVVRTAGPFDAGSLPPGLRRTHTVAEGRWGALRVIHGDAAIDLDLSPPQHRRLGAGAVQPIPPGVPHLVSLGQGAVIAVDFLAPAGAS
jgi:hypothetical protein